MSCISFINYAMLLLAVAALEAATETESSITTGLYAEAGASTPLPTAVWVV